jgi:hypothetical protein
LASLTPPLFHTTANVYSSTIIDELQKWLGDDSERILAYFYFDFQDSERDAQAFLRSILLQLVVKQPGISSSLEAFYNRHRHNTRLLSSDLLNMISLTVQDFTQVYIVADAMDECGDGEEILHVVEEMNNWGLSNLHVVLTSRPEADIESCIMAFLTQQIHLDRENVDADIVLYIRDVLKNDRKLARWPLSVRQKIQTSLEQGSCGMYERST